MKYIDSISLYLNKILGIDTEYIKLTILTIIVLLIFGILKLIVRKVYSKLPMNDKKKYFRNRKIKIILTIMSLIIIILIWGEKIQGIITLISFVSAGLTIAIREIIFNFFSGIYINFRKPFEVEDRIEIDGIKGDVINMHGLGFEMLEIGERVNAEQSTGRIVHVPNSYIFTKTLKNYTKVFKYIWNEMKFDIELDSDVEKTKEIIYDILHNNEVLKEIPKKTEDAVEEEIFEYRIYYNYLEPIIYTKIVGGHIELNLRYLVHPKKARDVEEEINEKILDEYRKGNIKLYIKD